MHIELIDLLRCPQDHEETWLVASFTAVEERIVAAAKLGCPVCGATYRIESGIAAFHQGVITIPGCSGMVRPDNEETIRLAAFLNLSRPGALAVLQGDFAVRAEELSELAQSRIIVLDAETRVDDTEQIASIQSDTRIPLGSSSADGIALEDATYLADAPRVLKQGGRLLCPAELQLPPGLMQVARDHENVVAESHGPVISLRRS